MKKSTFQLHKTQRCHGLTLIEITLVIGLMLALVSFVSYSITSMDTWKKGRSASESLKGVYVAQKSFLADHPTKDSSYFSSSALIPYLPSQSGSMPRAKSLEDEILTLDFSIIPPVWKLAGSTYDPSDEPTDGLWDVGNLNSQESGAAGLTGSNPTGDSTGSSGNSESLAEPPLSEG